MRAAVLALPALALAACQDDAPEERPEAAAPPPPVAVSQLAGRVWPPDAPDTAPAMAGDPMAENNMIVLDLSGSMESGRCSGDARDRAEAAKAALLAWIAANPGDNIGLVTFSDRGTRLDAPLGRGETHAEQLVAAIETARPGGATPLRSAMEQALSALEAQARRQGGLGTYRLIVITDGEASEGESPDALVARIAGDPANPVELHTIGFCIGGDHSLNDPQAVFYTDANSPEQLSAGLEATQGEAAAFTTAFEEIEP